MTIDFGLEDEVISSRVYNHYLTSYRHVMEELYGANGSLLGNVKDGVLSAPGYKNLNGAPRPHHLYAKALSNAWSTEVALNLAGLLEDPELVATANHWATIQAYYAVSHLLRAFVATRDGRSPEPRHVWLLEQIGDTMASRHLLPAPWNVICSGPEAAYQYPNLPSHVDLPAFSPMARPRPEHAWSSVCMALRTTRERRIRDRVGDWKKGQRKKRITAEERKRVGEKTKPTTLFDFLYRLRIRSNYSDADAFAAGILQPSEAVQLNESLRYIVSSTMFTLELLIDRQLPTGSVRLEAERFIGLHPKRVTIPVRERLTQFSA